MSKAEKDRATAGGGRRLQGGPGASDEDAHETPPRPDRTAKNPAKRLSDVSGGGGERDTHHSHDPEAKGDRHK